MTVANMPKSLALKCPRSMKLLVNILSSMNWKNAVGLLLIWQCSSLSTWGGGRKLKKCGDRLLARTVSRTNIVTKQLTNSFNKWSSRKGAFISSIFTHPSTIAAISSNDHGSHLFVCLFVCWVICFQVASILAAYLRYTRLRDPNHPRLGNL